MGGEWMARSALQSCVVPRRRRGRERLGHHGDSTGTRVCDRCSMKITTHLDHMCLSFLETAGYDWQLLDRNVQRFREGLVFQAHRRLNHSTLGLRVIKKKEQGVPFLETAGCDCRLAVDVL